MITAVYDSSSKACGQAYTLNGTNYDLTAYKYVYFTTPYVIYFYFFIKANLILKQ